MGYLLFIRGDTLMAQPFDNRRLELIGQASPIVEQIGDGRAFSVSRNGVLVFHRGPSPGRGQLTWYARDGKTLGAIGDASVYRTVALSPDGTQLALSKGAYGQAISIWLLDSARGGSRQIASGAAPSMEPVWAPEGARIVYSSNPDGPFNLYIEAVNGTKAAEALLKSPEDKFATSWSRDGRFLLYTVYSSKTKSDIWVLPLDGDRKPIPFLATEFVERTGRFSPDGHWVAYMSDESGQEEIYVRSFSLNPSGTAAEISGKWLISNDRGVAPRWRSDGRELYYQSLSTGKIMAVEVVPGALFRAGTPRPLEVSPGGTWSLLKNQP